MSDVKAQGRTQLKGLLDNLVQKSIEESRDDSIDADVEEAARDLLDLTDDTGRGRKRKHSKVGVKQRKKRKRKDLRKGSPDGYDLSNGVRYIPHVMTLFDRKVDLAKFSPETPLYVMCREWMSNNPDCTHATPPSQCHLTPHTLPPPTPLPMDKEGREVRIDIPKPHPPISKSREEMDNLIREGTSELAGDLGEYRRDHLRRWREVRSRWKVASAQNQLRYGTSLEILRGMFQKS
ncbi:protein lin-37 homolog isoform X2 [Halichondria panicea]|uniref:protein lin-37 homolog isoform X2 n=1 Tax=Halichondria panicea TaxID=6063 RepID=UPI00312B3983